MRISLLAFCLALVGCTSLRPNPREVAESYQLYLAPPFDTPLDLTVERTSDKAYVTDQKYRGWGGDAPKRKGYPRTRPISEHEWQTFAQAIKRSGFWTGQVRSYSTFGVLDGTNSLIIARSGESQRVVRFEPLFPVKSRDTLPLIEAFAELAK